MKDYYLWTVNADKEKQDQIRAGIALANAKLKEILKEIKNVG